VEVAIYRIVAVATTNVVTHASASTCQVTVQAAAGLVHLRVADDGVGLLAEATGTGIPSMRGRAEELGGRWGVAAGPSGGCVVSAEIPIGTP